MNEGFVPADLRSTLRPLEPGHGVNFSASERNYLACYGLDFSTEYPGLVHTMGAVQSGEYRLAVHLMRQQNADGSAIIVHGYYDHVGLYGHLIRYCLNKNLNVLTLDLPGHGLSTGAVASIADFDEYVGAVAAAIQATEPFLDKPWTLFGQSMGAAIAMEFVLGRALGMGHESFAAVVLLAPLIRPYRWPLGKLVYHAVKPFIKERPRGFSNNSEDQEFLKFVQQKDLLQATNLPLQWVTAMVSWMRRFKDYQDQSFAPIVIQGQQDRTVDWRFNMRHLQQRFNPRIFYIREARHHLVNESAAIRETLFQHLNAQCD